MINVRTPLRISFFGGGTDYPDYFNRFQGSVLGMTIDRYVYINIISLLDVINYKYRVAYSKLELKNDINDIEHPLVRAILQNYQIKGALDISIQSDLPGASGLGSSSACAVGLINLITHMQNKPLTRLDLAKNAIYIEQTVLKGNVGIQDQLHAAFGGLNRFDFHKKKIHITPLQMTTASLEEFLASLVLIYTGKTRSTSEITCTQIEATRNKQLDQPLSRLVQLVDNAVSILENCNPSSLIREFSELMRDGWHIKRQLSSKISSKYIDDLYQQALDAGALGGKLCGAGGGGFLLVLVPPCKKIKFMEKMKNTCLIPITMDQLGSTVS